MVASRVPSGRRRNRPNPARAPGTEPSRSRSTVGQCTARFTAYAPPPNSFITPAMSTSEPTAMPGGTPRRRMSAGVSKAPAPIEVMPTSSPTAAPTTAASGPKRAAGRATNGTAMAFTLLGTAGLRTGQVRRTREGALRPRLSGDFSPQARPHTRHSTGRRQQAHLREARGTIGNFVAGPAADVKQPPCAGRMNHLSRQTLTSAQRSRSAGCARRANLLENPAPLGKVRRGARCSSKSAAPTTHTSRSGQGSPLGPAVGATEVEEKKQCPRTSRP
jgi:hypothetical protein